MAYFVSIEKRCKARGCGRGATHELLDPDGLHLGFYCLADAKHEKRRIEITERITSAGSRSG